MPPVGVRPPATSYCPFQAFFKFETWNSANDVDSSSTKSLRDLDSRIASASCYCNSALGIIHAVFAIVFSQSFNNLAACLEPVAS